MKVLVVSHPCATAANQALFAEIRRLTGWDVRLVVPAGWRDEFGNALDQPDWPGMEGRVKNVPVVFNGRIILHAHRFHWAAFLRKEKFDAIYMHHEPYAVATGQVCLANAMSGRPAAFGFYSAQNLMKRYPPPFSWIEQLIHRSSSFAFPVSDSVAEILRLKKTRAALTVCPLPFDPALYFPRKEGPALGQAGEPVIGYVGRLVEPKGLRTLATALGELRELPWTFHAIGTGDFQSEFESLLAAQGLAGRAICHGYVPHHKTPEFLSAFDLLVVPSETQPGWKEQFGRVIIEALACGTAVVGSDSGEIPVLIESSGGGLVFPEKKPKALADSIRKLLLNPVLREGMAENGRLWATQNVSMEIVARRMADAIMAAKEGLP
ncbi:MAG: glycosyltransferase family 1 protein [Verrucomicrobiaceae bacterium]|nr:MAG: glycosyltransferase family 1 protein [Verrucomicrobiaceae bacterium]